MPRGPVLDVKTAAKNVLIIEKESAFVTFKASPEFNNPNWLIVAVR